MDNEGAATEAAGQTGTYLDTDRSYGWRSRVCPCLTDPCRRGDGRRPDGPTGADALLSWPCTPDQRPRPSINMHGLFLPRDTDGMGPACSAGGPDQQRARRPPGAKHDLQPLTTRPVASHGMLLAGVAYSTLSGHSRSFVSSPVPASRATPRRDKASIRRPAPTPMRTTTNRQPAAAY